MSGARSSLSANLDLVYRSLGSLVYSAWLDRYATWRSRFSKMSVKIRLYQMSLIWSQLTTPFLKMKVSRMFDSPLSWIIKSSFATSCFTKSSSSADTQQLSFVWAEQTFSISHSIVCRCKKVFLICTSWAY